MEYFCGKRRGILLNHRSPEERLRGREYGVGAGRGKCHDDDDDEVKWKCKLRRGRKKKWC